MRTLGKVLAVLDGWFDPATAESWDAVGLTCGDPDEPVERIHLALDAVAETVDEALAQRADLLITHHPLLLTAVHSVAADTAKGALIHRMVRGGLAHFAAHTNADVARPGVNDALANLLGLHESAPLEPLPMPPLDKVVVFVPEAAAAALTEALIEAGAGHVGDYDSCSFASVGVGQFRPLDGATPAIGSVGALEQVTETRLEMVAPRALRQQIGQVLRQHHPYEEPAFDVLELAAAPSSHGLGRLGVLEQELSLREFTQLCAQRLPATSWGVRAAGDPAKRVRRVAVCGGSGGSLIETARRAGADVFVTADLRHHVALDAATEHGANPMALVDAAHWATESPWLDALATRLSAHFGPGVDDIAEGLTVTVSRAVTDPWSLHAFAG